MMSFKLYRLLLKQSIAEMLSYRATAVFTVVFGVLFFAIEVIAGVIYFEYSDSILGWNKWDYLCLIGTSSIIQYSYQLLFSNAHENLVDQIIEGELDYIFVRPLNSFWFYALYRIDVPSVINLVISIAFQFYILQHFSITLGSAILYSFYIVLGVWLLFILNQVVVMVSFWKDRAYKLTGVPEYLVDASTRPRVVYPYWLKFLLGWVVPVLTALNTPVELLKSEYDIYQIVWYMCYLCVATIFVILMWHRGVRKYTSSN